MWTAQAYQRMLACCTAVQLPAHVGPQHTAHYLLLVQMGASEPPLSSLPPSSLLFCPEPTLYPHPFPGHPAFSPLLSPPLPFHQGYRAVPVLGAGGLRACLLPNQRHKHVRACEVSGAVKWLLYGCFCMPIHLLPPPPSDNIDLLSECLSDMTLIEYLVCIHSLIESPLPLPLPLVPYMVCV